MYEEAEVVKCKRSPFGHTFTFVSLGVDGRCTHVSMLRSYAPSTGKRKQSKRQVKTYGISLFYFFLPNKCEKSHTKHKTYKIYLVKRESRKQETAV